MTDDYIELGQDDVIREGDFHITNYGSHSPFIGNWIGLSVCECPWKVYRPRATAIRDAAVELLKELYEMEASDRWHEKFDSFTLYAANKLRNAIGISFEELR
jgi:hypothetical protein